MYGPQIFQFVIADTVTTRHDAQLKEETYLFNLFTQGTQSPVDAVTDITQ